LKVAYGRVFSAGELAGTGTLGTFLTPKPFWQRRVRPIGH